MKKIVFSIVSMLASLTTVLEAKTENPMLPEFLETEVERGASPAVVIAKHFFINPKEFQKMLDKRKESDPVWPVSIILHPKSSPFFKIIFSTLNNPKWNHIQLKEKVYSIQEFRKYITSQDDFEVTQLQLRRNIICVDKKELESYLSDWVDYYLDIKKEEKPHFLEDVMLAANKLSKGQSEKNVYLMIEFVVFSLREYY